MDFGAQAMQGSWRSQRKMQHKTKVELTMEIVRHRLEIGTKLDFVGAVRYMSTISRRITPKILGLGIKSMQNTFSPI